MTAPLRAVEQMAIEHLVCGEAELAIADLSKAINESPDEGRLWELLGIGQWELGVVQESIRSLETAMTLVPLRSEATLALALGYEVIQKQSLAVGLLIDVASRENLPTRILEPLARGLGRAGETAMALSVCQRAAAEEPSQAGPQLGVVFYMGQLGAPSKEKLPYLLRALSLDPEDFSIRMLAARCLHDCGLSEDAAELLRVADFLNSRCPSCLHAMQEIFTAAGDEDAANELIEQAAQVARESKR